MTLAEFYPQELSAPPAVLLSRGSLTPSGGRRPVSMKVFVRDSALYQRLRTEVCEGDRVRVTVGSDRDALDRGPTLIAFQPIQPRHQSG